jgi:hypothetical protein
MAVILTGCSPVKPGVNPKAVHVRFVVEKLALEQVFLQELRLSLANHSTNPPYSSIIVHNIRGRYKPVSDRSTNGLSLTLIKTSKNNCREKLSDEPFVFAQLVRWIWLATLPVAVG